MVIFLTLCSEMGNIIWIHCRWLEPTSRRPTRTEWIGYFFSNNRARDMMNVCSSDWAIMMNATVIGFWRNHCGTCWIFVAAAMSFNRVYRAKSLDEKANICPINHLSILCWILHISCCHDDSGVQATGTLGPEKKWLISFEHLLTLIANPSVWLISLMCAHCSLAIYWFFY